MSRTTDQHHDTLVSQAAENDAFHNGHLPTPIDLDGFAPSWIAVSPDSLPPISQPVIPDECRPPVMWPGKPITEASRLFHSPDHGAAELSEMTDEEIDALAREGDTANLARIAAWIAGSFIEERARREHAESELLRRRSHVATVTADRRAA